jgi:hypothetical protein
VDAPRRVRVLQVDREHAPGMVRVQTDTHSQQLAAQFRAIRAQQLHRHRPFTPAPKRVFKPEQSTEVVSLRVMGQCVDVERGAYPGL